MATTSQSAGRCPACDFAAGTDSMGRCAQCGADLSGSDASAVFRADAAIELLRVRYESIASEWRQWAAYRDYYAKAVAATVPATPTSDGPTLAHRDAGEETSPAPAFAEPAAVDAGSLAAADASAPEPAPAPAAATVAAPQPAPEPKPQRRASAALEALTAPALLGVAGASLLVAAAIVFVALAWTSFSPVARGSVVLAVGVLVAGIAVWVKRLGLVASSGAIGVVAMGFAGVATIAFLRDTGVVGSFDAATALLVAGIAGLVLSRFGIPWVGSAAALSMAASVASFTFAATATADRSAQAGGSVGAMPIWIVAGTGAASALAATHRLWRWTVARSVVAWASVVWLTVVGISVPVWIWGGDGGSLEAALGLLPVIALAIIATRWQLLATGPAAFLFTIIPPALAGAEGASPWAQAAVSAAAVTGALALGKWLPRRVLRPLLAGVAPAYAVVAVASAGYALSITAGRIVAGTYVPDTELWAGVAALLCGLAVATLRLWRLEWAVLRIATPIGAAMVAVGAGITSFGIAELTGARYYHSSVAVVLALAALGLVAMTRVWWDAAARLVTEFGVLVFLVTAAVHAYWALVISEFALVVSLAVVLVALAVFALRARSAPWWTLPFLTVGATVLAPALAARNGFETPIQSFALVAAASAIAWTAWRLPRAIHPHVAIGLAPALAVGVIGASASAVSTFGTLVSSTAPAGRSAWWDAAALALALALATWNRWHLPALAHRAVPIAGAVVVLVSGAGFAVSAAGMWGAGLEGIVPLWVLVAALAVLPVAALWNERTAAWVNGVGSAALATLAGLNALGYVAVPWNPLWLPLGVAIGAIAVLAIGAVRWPVVSLAPAVALATGLGLVLALRADGGLTVAVAVASAVGAVAVWLPLRGLRRVLAAAGAALALVGGAAVALMGAYGALLELTHLSPAQGSTVLGWFSLLAFAAVAAGLLAAPRIVAQWLAAGRAAPWRAAAIRAASWALISMALAALIAVTAFVSGASWSNLSVAALARTATAALAGAALAAAYSVGRRGALFAGPARRTARIGATSWLAFVAVVAGVEAWSVDVWWQAAAGAYGIALVALTLMAVGWRRAGGAAPPRAVTAIPLILVAAEFVSTGWGVAVGALIGAAIAWLATFERAQRIAPPSALRLGLVPIALVTVPVALTEVVLGFRSLLQHVLSDEATAPSGWWAFTLLAVVAGALSMPRLKAFAAPFATTVLALSLGSAPLGWTVAVLVAAMGLLLWAHTRVEHSARGAVIAGVAALGWATHDWLLVALAAGAFTASGIVVLRRQAARPSRVVAGATPVLAGLTLFAVAHATHTGVGEWIAGPAAFAGVVGVGALVWGLAPLRARADFPWVLAAATIVVPLASGSLASAGTALLIAAVGWFALATRGVAEARWYAALAASAGVSLIALDAGATAIEAYTLTPAACALALGVSWMRTNPRVSSVAALSPGLAIALVPSYLALVAEPDNLARTAWLTVVMVALALVGMSRRWFAPVAATAITAVLVAVLQVVVGTNLVFRLIAFLIVGTLLLVAASWFDKIKALR